MNEATNQPLISVVIPVYNVEKYLPKCVLSVVEQSYESIEIILVDDGAKDRSGSLCEELAQKDSRIQVIHKTNGGLSSARNAGIDAAKGTYITFIDSDDYVEKNYISLLYHTLIQNDADMSVAAYDTVYEDDKKVVRDSPVVNEVLEPHAFWQKVYSDHGWEYVVAWNKLYKKELFQNIRFMEGKYHEDEIILDQIICQCRKIAATDAVLYHYIQRSGSIMNSSYNIRNLDVVTAYLQRDPYFKESGFTDLVKLNQTRIYWKMIWNLPRADFKNSECFEKYQYYLKKTLKCCGLNLRICKLLLNLCTNKVYSRCWWRHVFFRH